MLIVCDFDESAANGNAAQAILAELQNVPDSLHAAFRSGKLPFKQYQEKCFTTGDVTAERISALAAELISLRPGFADAVAAAGEVGARFIVASAGLKAYIRPVLARNGFEHIPVLAVSVTTDPATGRIIQYDYPEAEPWCNDDWAVCKCRPMRSALAEDEEVIFIGDGLRSDPCAAATATKVFARGRLLDYCRENGIPATAYEDFTPIAEYIRSRAPVSSP